MSAIRPSSERGQIRTDHLIDFLNDIDGAIMKCLESSHSPFRRDHRIDGM